MNRIFIFIWRTFLVYLCVSVSSGTMYAAVEELTVTPALLYTNWAETNEFCTGVLTIETPAIAPSSRYPVQVVLLIDASLEMEGAAIQQAKLSAQNIINLLSDDDLFGLVTYSQYVSEVFALQPLNPNNRKNALSAVNRIKYEKGRDLSEGLKKGAEQFTKYKGQRCSGQYLVILTNGNPDMGITDREKLTDLASTLAHKNTFQITTIGYDKKFDELFLIGCSQKTGGRAYFIEEEQIAQLTKIITSELKRITATCVKSLTIECFLPSGTTIKTVSGATLQDGKIVIGDLPADMRLMVVFTLAGRPSRSKEIEFSIDYNEPVRLTNRKARLYLDMPVAAAKAEFDEQYAPQLLDYTTKQGLYEAVEQIRTGEKYVRNDFGNSFKKTILSLEQDNVQLKSDYLTQAIIELKKTHKDLVNEAIENDLLLKRIKYSFLLFSYGQIGQ